jgi:2-dehydro-3-deoxygluconokinase
MPDVVTFGEAMVRLAPPNFQRLEQTRSLDTHAGGAEMNVAVGVTRFGLSSAWVSRLPKNGLGRFTENQARQFGVDTSNVVWSDSDRMGLYFVEFGAAPRASSVFYDRAGSAISAIQPGEVDWKSVFEGCKVFHTTGITPALSDSAAEVTMEALKAAKAAGATVTYDLNFRGKLWSREKAREVQTPMMEYIDVLITTEEDTGVVFDIYGDSYKDVAVKMADQFGFDAVAITLRGNPSVWKNTWTAIVYGGGKFYETKEYELEVVDRVGGGDSFSAGFVWGVCQGDYQKGLDYGVAFSALKHSVPGDLNYTTFAEVEKAVEGSGMRITR